MNGGFPFFVGDLARQVAPDKRVHTLQTAAQRRVGRELKHLAELWLLVHVAAAGHTPCVLAVDRGRNRRNMLSTALQVVEEVRKHSRVVESQRVIARIDLRLPVLRIDEEVQLWLQLSTNKAHCQRHRHRAHANSSQCAVNLQSSRPAS